MKIEIRIIHGMEIDVAELWDSEQSLKDYVMSQLAGEVDYIDDIAVEEVCPFYYSRRYMDWSTINNGLNTKRR